MKWTTILTALTLCVNSFTQTLENFTDGNFTHDPEWVGDTSKFSINQEQQLQLNDTLAGTAWLGTRIQLDASVPAEWRMFLAIDFAPSNSNRVECWLLGDSLKENGIFLRIGESGSNDALRLMQRVHGTDYELLAGLFGMVSSAFEGNLLIRRSDSGEWMTWLTINEDFLFVGSGMEQAVPGFSWMGVQCFYTNSNVDGFVFDDMYFGPWETDTLAPHVEQVEVIDAMKLGLQFSETILSVQQPQTSWVQLEPNVAIDSIVQPDDSFLEVFLTDSLVSNQVYQLNVSGWVDTAGNEIDQNISGIVYYHIEKADYADVVISEIMADPDPTIGLPEIEYVELYNRSDKIVSLQNWAFSDGSTVGFLPETLMLPKARTVLCKAGCQDSFPKSIGLSSWPSLNNGGELLTLRNSDSLLVDSVRYSEDWYGSVPKDGRSLERINLGLLCSNASNWGAANAVVGGSPGSENSINDDQHLLTTNTLIDFEFLAQSDIRLRFSQPLDSSKLAEVSFGSSIQNNLFQLHMPSTYAFEIYLGFEQEFPMSTPFELTVFGINNCNNIASEPITRQLVLSEPVDSNDLIINELLFDPYSGGVDFVEVMNRTEKYLNLKGVQIQRKNGVGEVVAVDSIGENIILAPFQFLAFTEELETVCQHYPFCDSTQMYELDLPNFPNDSGMVVLTVQKQIVDEFNYQSDMHFQLLSTYDGKSLERMNSELPSNQRNNWHTSSESVGFATPGRKNSQTTTSNSHGKIHLASNVISPDNDGFEDVLQVEYQLDAPGYLVTTTVYSKWGVPVKHLTSNELVGPNGAIIWDGLSDDNNKTSIGEYVLIFEAIHSTNGSTFAQKLPIIVAGKL